MKPGRLRRDFSFTCLQQIVIIENCVGTIRETVVYRGGLPKDNFVPGLAHFVVLAHDVENLHNSHRKSNRTRAVEKRNHMTNL